LELNLQLSIFVLLRVDVPGRELDGMSFNPTLPANNSQVSSAELRNQFNGLKSLIDALPPGVTQQELADAFSTLQTAVNEAFSVLQQDLNSAAGNLGTEINAVRQESARNVDGINILDLGITDPPTQSDVQAIVDKLNELIVGLHR